jgi:RNA polymerase-binding transcription factor DksA
MVVASDEPADDRPTAPVPGPAVTAERDRELAALRAVQGDLADVEAALGRLDEGTYGRCEACGEAIDDDLLAATPTARLCAAHGSVTDAVADTDADAPVPGT